MGNQGAAQCFFVLASNVLPAQENLPIFLCYFRKRHGLSMLYLLGVDYLAIHILDFIAYLAGSQDIEIDISALDPQYQQSKRSGFLEITGTIRGSMGRCRAFALSSYQKQGFPVSTVILSDICRIHIMEWKKELEYADASTGWEWQKQTF